MSKSAEHTPGPWMVLPSIIPSQFVVLTEHGSRQDIAVTYGFESTPRMANARLIAAAPDLLEALKYARRMVRASDCDTVFIDAAIAKATGSPS